MRVCSIVLCVLLGVSATATAQDAAVGVKGGVNFANLKFDGEGVDTSFDRRTGFVGGVFVVWPANSRLAVQAEALYSQKGAKIEEGGDSGKIKLDYLEIPVLLRVSSSPRSGASFHVVAGPSFAFRLRARGNATVDGESSSEDISDDVKRMDAGLAVGAGVDIGRFTVEGRQTWGLTDINRDPEDADVKVKNRAFTVLVGVRF